MKIKYFNKATKYSHYKRVLTNYCTYALIGAIAYAVLYIACVGAGYQY